MLSSIEVNICIASHFNISLPLIYVYLFYIYICANFHFVFHFVWGGFNLTRSITTSTLLMTPFLTYCNSSLSNGTTVMFVSTIWWYNSPAHNFPVASHPLTGVQIPTYYLRPLTVLILPIFPVLFPTIPSYTLYTTHTKQPAQDHTAAKVQSRDPPQTVWFQSRVGKTLKLPNMFNFSVSPIS